ncbi:MAG: hypothetical protein ACRDUA_09920 [Micromonosporaceae bacterium]
MQSPLEQYSEALDTVEITATSPRRWVTVHRSASGVVRTTLRPGALSRLSEPELAGELQRALTDAYRSYRRECRDLRRSIFGADVVSGAYDDPE